MKIINHTKFNLSFAFDPRFKLTQGENKLNAREVKIFKRYQSSRGIKQRVEDGRLEIIEDNNIKIEETDQGKQEKLQKTAAQLTVREIKKITRNSNDINELKKYLTQEKKEKNRKTFIEAIENKIESLRKEGE